MMRRSLMLFGLFLAGFLSLPALARDVIAPRSATSLSILTLSFSDPTPILGEDISASVSSDAADLDSSAIAWYKNDALIGKGVGMKSIRIGPAEKGETTIKAVVGDGDSSQEVADTFSSGLVSLTWEADSYTPPLYAGKAVPPPLGKIRFFATPLFSDTSSMLGKDASNISYTWKLNGQTVSASSGQGKDSFETSFGFSEKDITVEVEAESLDTGEIGRAVATVPAITPKILLYEENPLSGLLTNRTLGGTVKLFQPEISLFAVPFGAEKKGSFSWKMNDSVLEETGGSLTLRSKAGDVGTSSISVSFDPRNPFQAAFAELSIFFLNKSAPSSVFNTAQ